MQSKLANIKAVVFDLDGTLVHCSLDFKEMRRAIGCPAETDILAFLDDIQCNEQKATANRVIREMEQQDVVNTFALEGATELLNHLVTNNLQSAIITRNSQATSIAKLQRAELDHYFTNSTTWPIITRDNAPAKPNPASLLSLASELAIATNEILYVGDFRYDIELAKNAGAFSCLVLDDKPEYANDADIHVANLRELKFLLSKVFTK
jgi:HAD superfamily hydrolase (TIGR01549 family)